MNKQKLIGNLSMLMAATIWAINIPISKIVMTQWVDPHVLMTFRIVFATLAFWIASLFIPQQKIDRKDYVTFFVCGLFGMLFNTLFFGIGLSKTSPIDAAIIPTFSPILVMVLAAVFLKEPISGKKITGVLVGAFGALMLILLGAVVNNSGQSSLIGNLICLASTLSYGTYIILGRTIVHKYHPFILMRWCFLIASIAILPFTYSQSLDSIVRLAQAPFPTIIEISYVLVLATFTAYLLLGFAQKLIRPTTVAAYNYVQPLVSSIVAISIGQAALNWVHPAAGIMIFAGVYLITISKSKADIHPLK